MTIDLKNWKLTLPVDKNNLFTGTAAEVKVLEGFSVAPYFCKAINGDIVFSAPAEGATTSGSHYPRSELRELIKGKEAAWTIDKGGELTALLRVQELPKKSDGNWGRMVIGQIHGPDDELCRLYFDKGKIYYINDKSGDRRKELTHYLIANTGVETDILLGEEFSYSILVALGMLRVTVTHKGVKYQAHEKINSFWKKKALYFKAGVYLQVGKPGSKAGTTGTGVGTAVFSDIDIYH